MKKSKDVDLKSRNQRVNNELWFFIKKSYLHCNYLIISIPDKWFKFKSYILRIQKAIRHKRNTVDIKISVYK